MIPSGAFRVRRNARIKERNMKNLSQSDIDNIIYFKWCGLTIDELARLFHLSSYDLRDFLKYLNVL